MKRLIYTFRYLTRNRGNNLIRILSMTLGLAVGAILLSQVAFDTSFDRFYPDANRIYQAQFVWVGENEDDVVDGLFGEPWSVLRDELPGTVSGTIFSPSAIYVLFITRTILTFSKDCTTPIPYFSIFSE